MTTPLPFIIHCMYVYLIVRATHMLCHYRNSTAPLLTSSLPSTSSKNIIQFPKAFHVVGAKKPTVKNSKYAKNKQNKDGQTPVPASGTIYQCMNWVKFCDKWYVQCSLFAGLSVHFRAFLCGVPFHFMLFPVIPCTGKASRGGKPKMRFLWGSIRMYGGQEMELAIPRAITISEGSV